MIRPGFDLDFVAPHPLALTRSGRRMLAGAGVLWLAAVGVALWPQSPGVQVPVASVATPPPRVQKAPPQWSAAQRQSVESVVLSLQVPWAQWIDRTARAAPAGVSLLAFEPDVARGVLSLQAQADRLSSMVKYVRILEQDAHLGQALLRDFESVPESSKVRFTIDAALQGTPASQTAGPSQTAGTAIAAMPATTPTAGARP